MNKVIRPAVALFSSICLAALLLAGCQEQKTKTEDSAVSGNPEKPATSGPPAPLDPVPSVTPPTHPVSLDQPARPVPDLESLQRINLTEIEVGESEDGAVTRITLAGDGPFGSNVIRKENPERVILLIHNADAGDLVGDIEVNNGVINRIEVAQLESGKGPAARVTVGLTGKSEFNVAPAENGLLIDFRRRPK
jgi:hypothetical protein